MDQVDVGPTMHLVGSSERLRVMEARASKRLPTKHAGDVQDMDSTKIANAGHRGQAHKAKTRDRTQKPKRCPECRKMRAAADFRRGVCNPCSRKATRTPPETPKTKPAPCVEIHSRPPKQLPDKPSFADITAARVRHAQS